MDFAKLMCGRGTPRIVRLVDPGVNDSGYTVPTIWVNSATDSAFICVDNAAGAAVWLQLGLDDQITFLDITGTIAADTNFSVTSSGVNYTKSGADANILASAVLFNAAAGVKIFLNGVYLRKGVSAIWVNTTTIKLDIIVNNGDEIVILS